VLPEERRERRARERRRRTRRRRLAALAALGLAAAGLGAFLGLRGGAGRASPPGPRTAARASHALAPPARARPSRTVLSLPARLPARTLRVPILMYHRIDLLKPSLPTITRRLTVAPADFAAQMRWLARSGYHTLTQRQLFEALEHGQRLPPRPILITFDDGYRDVLGKAAPVLRSLRMHATAYVITGRISGPDVSFLTWPELHALERSGIEIGSHTVHHLELTGLSDPQALQELIRSRAALERHLGHPVQWFAYPAGAFSAHAAELVRQAGYVLAVTTRPGAVQDARAPLELRRLEILDSTGVAGLGALLRS